MPKIFKTTLCGLLAITIAAMPLNVYASSASQEETIYAKLQPDGSLDYTSVSKHLFNSNRSNILNDTSILQNIENINGFETYKIENNQVSWQANGNDIYYKGQTEKSLPISLELTYKLNDEVKPLDEILGKSGTAELHFHYCNSSKVGNLYTPFVVAMTTTLPSSAHNINITNGKIISNGRNFIITALAAPGLHDSLQMPELQNLDDIILTYDTDNFALSDIYNIVTPKLLDQSDLKIFDEVDKLSSSAQKLSDSSRELVNGSNSLRDGVQKLRDSIAAAQTQLQSTSQLLDEKTLDQIADTAANAARQKLSRERDTIRAQIHRQISGMTELNQLENNLVNQLSQAKALEVCMKTNTAAQPIPTAPTTPTDTSAENDTDTTESADTPTTPVTPPAINCADPAILQQYLTVVKSQVAQQVAGQLNLAAMEERMFQSTYASLQQVAMETAATTARSVAMQVATSIQEGLGNQLENLINKMLVGVDQLLDGANKLNDGLKKFDQEGIQTLNNLVNSKLKSTSDKAKRLTQLAHDYNNFSGINEDGEGDVKFILMIDAKQK